MSAAFVGTRAVASAEALRQALETIPATARCYFLRWVHQVKWANETLPAEFPSPEGELITPQFELRWKTTPQGYDLLLLADAPPPELVAPFEPLPQAWTTAQPLAVHLLAKDQHQDVRYPQDLAYPNNLSLQQRYFQDQQTGTVHFVALTLAG